MKKEHGETIRSPCPFPSVHREPFRLSEEGSLVDKLGDVLEQALLFSEFAEESFLVAIRLFFFFLLRFDFRNGKGNARAQTG